MDGLKKINIINLKKNTNLLIDYLEVVIADEMILNSFLRTVKIIHENNSQVIISTKTKSAFEIIKENYLKIFNDAIKNVYQKKLEIKLVINDEYTPKTKELNFAKNISLKYNFKNYIEGDFNQETIKMAKKIIIKTGVFSPFFITSASGLGKSHLLHAMGNQYISNGFSCMYIEPNLFTKNIIKFSKEGGDSISNYIDELLEYDVLLFDDIQNLGDRVVTLRVLFQILNVFIEQEKQIVISSDKSPNELLGFESRFITRFNSGLTSTITKPLKDDLLKILEFKLKEKKLSPEKWEKEALKFIVRNNSSSIRSIEGAIKRVCFYVDDSENIKYTYKVISNIFKELTIDQDELTSDRIINIVSNYYKLSKNNVIGKSRKANIMIARHMGIWLVRKILNLPFKEIGKIFGNRDHSTIISSIKKIDKKMSTNNIIKVAAERIERKIKTIV